MLETNLINNFRSLVNEHQDFIMHVFIDEQVGNNKWNIICSAMDWITMAVNNLNEISLEFERERIDNYSMRVYTYISMIDIIFQSITQLYRVIFDEKKAVFDGEKSVFSNNVLKDDNRCFKNIRAIFGAHPVNLKNGNEKWYASWPIKAHVSKENYDLEVFLYPLKTDKKFKRYGIYFVELNKFIELRYKYLKVLGREIERQFEDYRNRLINKKIEYTNNCLENLMISKKELKTRLPNDYFDMMIDEAIRFMKVYNDIKIGTEFIDEIKKFSDDIKNMVQNLDFTEKDSYKYSNVRIPSGDSYILKKYFSVLNGKYDGLEKYYFEKISKLLEEYISLEEHMSNDEKHFRIHVGLYRMNYFNE